MTSSEPPPPPGGGGSATIGAVNVFDGALRIAREEYPALDADDCRRRLDDLAADGRRGLSVDALNDLVFGRHGFRGNREDYYDPRNSYLNDVLDRRLGIPITLATVYAEIGRRLGLAVDGVGFPGHFLARVSLDRGHAIVDCFDGRTLTREDCATLLQAVAPGAPPERLDDFLEPAEPRDVLRRMTANLQRIYAERGDFARAARWIGVALEIAPGRAEDYRERGLLLARADRPGAAIEDLERYLRLAPHAPDASALRARLANLRKLLSQLN